MTIFYSADQKYTQCRQFPFSIFNVFQKRSTVRLEQVPGETLPKWHITTWYSAIGNEINSGHWIAFSFGCIVAFLFGLAAINFFSGYSLEWDVDGLFANKKEMLITRGKILLIGLILSIVIGGITYVAGRSTNWEDYLPGYTYQFIWKELLFHIVGVYLSGLLWIVALHFEAFLKKLSISKPSFITNSV